MSCTIETLRITLLVGLPPCTMLTFHLVVVRYRARRFRDASQVTRAWPAVMPESNVM